MWLDLLVAALLDERINDLGQLKNYFRLLLMNLVDSDIDWGWMIRESLW